MFKSTIRNAWRGLLFGREQIQAGVGPCDGLEGRSSLGPRRQGMAADHRAERHLRARHVGDHRGQPLYRLLQEGLEGADDRPVLVGRQRDQARAAPLDQPRHEDLPDDGSRTRDAADSGERDRPGRSRRHAHRLHERRRARERAERARLPARDLLPDHAARRPNLSAARQGRRQPPELRGCRARQGSERVRPTRPSTCCSRWRRASAEIEGRRLDFRDEIYGHLFKPGDSTADRRHGVRHLGVEQRPQEPVHRGCRP